jgi:hypothetical protein
MRHFEYARNSYRDGFFEFLPCSSSRALPHTSSHRHRGDCYPHRPGFSTGASHTHSEPRQLDGLCFPRRGSCPTGSSGEVLKIMKTSSGCMVKCWIPKIYLTNPSIESSTFSRPM